MTTNINETALRVARELGWLAGLDGVALRYAKALVAELQKDATPVARVVNASSNPNYEIRSIEHLPNWADLPPVGTEIFLNPQPKAATVPQGWKSLSDVQWMNIVNHDRAYENYSKEDAVHEAVKRTEAKLRELNAAPSLPAQSKTPDAYSFEIDGQPGRFFGTTVPPYGKNPRALVYASQSEGEQRECGCGWSGPTSEAVMCGSVGPLCPECRETTEPSLPAAEDARDGKLSAALESVRDHLVRIGRACEGPTSYARAYEAIAVIDAAMSQDSKGEGK